MKANVLAVTLVLVVVTTYILTYITLSVYYFALFSNKLEIINDIIRR